MTHLNLDFPRDVAAGCQCTIERRDEVVTLSSGHEETNQRWIHSRRSWDAGLAIRSEVQMSRVVDLFEAARGRLHSFAFRDWLDWSSAPPGDRPGATDQVIGIADGVSSGFQLVKRYGSINSYARPITLPDIGSLVLAVDGVQVHSGWSIGAVGGLVTFDVPPPAGAEITAGYLFDTPVRFAEKSLIIDWAYFSEDGGCAAAPAVSLIEVRLDGEV